MWRSANVLRSSSAERLVAMVHLGYGSAGRVSRRAAAELPLCRGT